MNSSPGNNKLNSNSEKGNQGSYDNLIERVQQTKLTIAKVFESTKNQFNSRVDLKAVEANQNELEKYMKIYENEQAKNNNIQKEIQQLKSIYENKIKEATNLIVSMKSEYEKKLKLFETQITNSYQKLKSTAENSQGNEQSVPFEELLQQKTQELQKIQKDSKEKDEEKKKISELMPKFEELIKNIKEEVQFVIKKKELTQGINEKLNGELLTFRDFFKKIQDAAEQEGGIEGEEEEENQE